MNRRLWWVVAAIVLLGAACGSEGENSSSPSETGAISGVADEATGSATEEPSEAPTEGTTEAPATAPTEEPPEEPADGDGVGSATLTIGDETWTFDKVDACLIAPTSQEDVSFILIAKQGDLQLTAKIFDDTGAKRLEGEGVFDRIDFLNVVDGTQALWLASSEATGEQFLVLDGLSVTASAIFADLRTDSDESPGTLDATCP